MSQRSDLDLRFMAVGSTDLRPRVILKTHSGVRAPGIFSVLIGRCTSATRPMEQANLVKKLAAEFKHVPRETLKGATLGERGASFHAVWMAKPEQLGFLTSNLFWSWKGHVISMLTSRGPDADASSFLDLNLAEQLIYLKYYLEGDGAILIALARELVSRGGLTEDDLVRSDLLEQSLRSIWTAYSDLSTSITERVRLRERLRRQRYDPTTRRHKTYPHLLPLEDIGLLVRVRTNGRDEFAPSVYDGRTPLQTIVDAFPTIGEMENSLDGNQHSSILADAIVPEHRPFSHQSDFDYLIQTTVECYQAISQTGAMICPIDAISDVCFARMLSQQQVFVTRRNVDDGLAELESQFPKEVRFHVDRSGMPTYIALDERLVGNLLAR